MASITRYRGDTVPDKIRVKDVDGAAVNISGCSFTLTINRQKEPVDVSQQLAEVAGTIVSPTAGTVEFVFSPTQADIAAGQYYYDIKMIDTLAHIHTISYGTYTFRQTIHQ